VSSVYSYSDSIAKAFLPSQGMRFEGAGDARVHDWQPALASAVGASRRTVAAQLPGNYPAGTTTNSTPAANGTISGGMLRPGAIDQSQFKAMLAAGALGAPPLAQGPVTGRPPLAPMAAMAAQGLQPATAPVMADAAAGTSDAGDSAIQTLSPAQFAALTGAMPAASGQSQVQGTLQGNGQSQLPAGVPAAFRDLPPDTLTMTDAAIPADGPDAGTATAATKSPGNTQTATAATGDPKTGDQTPIGSTDKNGVLVLNQIPDRDTRREYAEKGIKWRIVDDPAANKLFFGPDGKFGWDDVVDLINPLQHIPLLNIAYRHFTGDQINGSAELLGAIPFGPISALAAIADLAVRSTTGKDVGENVIAMISGDHDGTAATGVVTAAADTTTPTAVASVEPDPYAVRETGHS
jgi:hypothetical protein